MNPASPSNRILSAWNDTLRQRRNDAAILSPDGAIERTFQGIEEEAQELEEKLAQCPARSAVGVRLGNEPSWPAILLALFRHDLVPTPVGLHMEGAELERALSLCGMSALVTAGHPGPLLEECKSPPIRHDCDFLKLTSGTTGAPRAIRFTAEQLLADCENICGTMGLTEDDVNFGVIPFSHSYGFSNLITPLMCRGIPLVAAKDPLPRAIAEGLRATGATVFPGTPILFDKLAALPHPPPLPRLRLCISAGASFSVDTARQFTQRFARKIQAFYGSSECGGIAFDRGTDGVYTDRFAGLPMQGVAVEAVDGEGEESGPCRIAVRSAAVAIGYYPEEDPGALSGGQFIPGDLLRLRPEGLYIAGRAADFINIAGRKLNPGDVESIILNFPGVRQAVVFGIPSTLRGEEPVACVAGDGIDGTALRQFCRERLSRWQAPREFWLVAEVPANDRGKISRRALAAQFATLPHAR